MTLLKLGLVIFRKKCYFIVVYIENFWKGYPGIV